MMAEDRQSVAGDNVPSRPDLPPVKVPTRTVLGRGAEFVEVDDPLAAQHWDGRLWTADPL
jgi:hypothetical protein